MLQLNHDKLSIYSLRIFLVYPLYLGAILGETSSCHRRYPQIIYQSVFEVFKNRNNISSLNDFPLQDQHEYCIVYLVSALAYQKRGHGSNLQTHIFLII